MKKLSWIHPAILYSLIGGLAGLTYVVLDEGVLDEMTHTTTAFLVLHEFVDAIFPILLGLTVGLGFYLYKRQSRMMNRLSLNNDRLQRDLLFNTLISQMLHEIRNPLHNIRALVEENEAALSEEARQILQRNLDKIETLKTTYGKWGHTLDGIQPAQSMIFKPWFDHFLEDKLKPSLGELKTDLQSTVSPVQIAMHPLLTEQALMTIFSNALEALREIPAPQRRIQLKVFPSPDKTGFVELRLTNTGPRLPDAVLASQGKHPVESRYGLGLGLMLLRKILEQVGGRLKLKNTASDEIEISLLVRGDRV